MARKTHNPQRPAGYVPAWEIRGYPGADTELVPAYDTAQHRDAQRGQRRAKLTRDRREQRHGRR